MYVCGCFVNAVHNFNPFFLDRLPSDCCDPLYPNCAMDNRPFAGLVANLVGSIESLSIHLNFESICNFI